MNLNCAPEIKGRLVSRDLLRTEWGLYIPHDAIWFETAFPSGPKSLNSSASKYLVFVTSHSDLPVSPSLFLFTSLLHLIHQHYKIQYWKFSNTFEKWVETQWLSLLKYLFVLIKIFWKDWCYAQVAKSPSDHQGTDIRCKSKRVFITKLELGLPPIPMQQL